MMLKTQFSPRLDLSGFGNKLFNWSMQLKENFGPGLNLFKRKSQNCSNITVNRIKNKEDILIFFFFFFLAIFNETFLEQSILWGFDVICSQFSMYFVYKFF